jgi:uncharacterized protein YjdB
MPCSKSEKGSYTNALLRKQPNLLISQSVNILRIPLQNGRQEKQRDWKARNETRNQNKREEKEARWCTKYLRETQGRERAAAPIDRIL